MLFQVALWLKVWGVTLLCVIYLPTSRCVAVVVVQSPHRVQLFVTLWTAARQASLSLTISWSLPKFTFIALVMLSNHLVL